MATPVLTHSGVEPSKAFNRFAMIYSGPLSDLPMSEARASVSEAGGVTVSTAAGLSCARGALMALGIEVAAAVAALCLYGVSRL